MAAFGTFTQVRRVVCYTLLALLMSISSVSYASPILVLPEQSIINLGDKVKYLVDTKTALSLGEFRSPENQSQLISSKAPTPSYGFTQSTYWFQVELKNASNRSAERTLVISYPLLDQLNIYLLRSQGHVTRFETGDRLDFDKREELHRFFTFPIVFQKDETITLVVQTKTTSSMQVPMELWIPEQLHHDDKETLLAQGIYYGIMLIMVVYNLFIFLVVRTPGYLFYVFYVGSVAGFQAAISGIGYQFLWPLNPWFQDIAIGAFIPLIATTGTIFTIYILQTKERNPRLHPYIRAIASLGLVLVVSSLFVPYSTIIKLNLICGTFAITMVFALGVINWKNNFEVAKYFTVAWLAFLGGGALMILNKAGILPRNAITEHAMQIGSILEVSLLSFALAYRMNTLQAEKIAAEKKSQVLQSALNTELKTKLNIFSSVAHELNNPLNYVSVGTQNLRRQVAKLHTIVSQLFEGAENNENAMEVKRVLDKTFDEHSQTLEDTLFGAQRAADVVAEMRGLTEVDGKLLRVTDPKELIDSALRRARDILSPGKFDQVNIDYDYSDLELEVEVNPYLITHALTNILTNAVRYALNQDQQTPQIQLHAHLLGDMVHMVVANNGEPIPTQMMDTIFNEETSDDAIHNLSISRSLIRQQGGELQLLQAGDKTLPVKFEIQLPKSNAIEEPPLLNAP
ncbi:MAG: sensor histidine kinase [Deltaproteobacteria bacterium]|nr:sensor histidine kinase [Deltaproteobacteria bacterium]